MAQDFISAAARGDLKAIDRHFCQSAAHIALGAAVAGDHFEAVSRITQLMNKPSASERSEPVPSVGAAKTIPQTRQEFATLARDEVAMDSLNQWRTAINLPQRLQVSETHRAAAHIENHVQQYRVDMLRRDAENAQVSETHLQALYASIEVSNRMANRMIGEYSGNKQW